MENNAIVLTTAVLGIVQAFKIAGMPTKFSPILAMLAGIIVYIGLEGISPQTVITGLVIGLGAVGLYTTGSQFGDEGNISKQEKEAYKENLRR